MCNKPRFIVLLGCALCILVGCKTTSNDKIEKRKVSISFSNDSVAIFGDTSKQYTIQLQLSDKISITKTVIGNQIVSYWDLVKGGDLEYDMAYLLAINRGVLTMNMTLEGVIDTTFIHHFEINEVNSYSVSLQKGTCASVSGSFDASNIEADIIKWLYRKQKNNASDSLINCIRLYLQELNRTDYQEYISKESIPVIPSFKNVEYKISSDLVADNYYLFACTNQHQIDEFVEEMVSIKFDGATHSLGTPMCCLR